MAELIDFESYPVNLTKKILLQDKATKQNIIWATDSYEQLGYEYFDNSQIQVDLISGINKWIVEPRVQKHIEQQQQRTRSKAEVFTPAWLCNKMNNLCDEQWFGKNNVFNNEDNIKWSTNPKKIEFPYGKNWQTYLDLRKLEITCGEAPFLCSRYDMSSGQIIPIDNRIGILDRKMRVVNENTSNKNEWIKWTIRAFQSCYGYEYQGDSLLIARINMMLSFYEYYRYKWNEEPTKTLLNKIANIISWNLWQMDGLKGTVPNGVPNKINIQLSIKGFLESEENQETNTECYLKNWRADRSLYYSDLKGVKRKMKFDFVIGNPPYQDNTLGENNTYAPPVYNKFMDAVYEIADKVELIHPARFLFNAGSTPKQWNKKMLQDVHFKILHYEDDGSKFFTNTDIKGGIVISYRDCKKSFGAIDVFTPYPLLNKILHKVSKSENFKSMTKILVSSYSYHFTEKVYEDYPNAKGCLSKGHDYDFKSNVFSKMPQPFFTEAPDDGFEYLKIIGRENNQRTHRYIRKEYVESVCNLFSYKVFMSGATGSGVFGEIIAPPIIEAPGTGATETFLSIGTLSTYDEANAVVKYIKTKFARAMFGVLKRTQANTPDKWKYVPLQDFTENSDIDWTKSIHEIDLQLYKKYNLDENEIEFIEKNVKEMS
ncbi:MAG: Eco57I restriction-modification methylase domain-containing protein [Acutalibacteraceae bacterium]|nr:Eco57I restriction-modification methylase domain-containing protein [Acutalibacteraceae bacterium]